MKKLQEVVNTEKNQRLQNQEESCSLKIKLNEAVTQLNRSRALSKLSVIEEETHVEGVALEKKSEQPQMVEEASECEQLHPDDKDRVQKKHEEEILCVFELCGQCSRKEKCRFNQGYSSQD